jgi:hypothetical protein
MHGVIKSAGSSTKTGTQFPRFSRIISCSTVASEGYAGNFYGNKAVSSRKIRKKNLT